MIALACWAAERAARHKPLNARLTALHEIGNREAIGLAERIAFGAGADNAAMITESLHECLHGR